MIGAIAFNSSFVILAFLGLIIFGEKPLVMIIGAVAALVCSLWLGRIVYGKLPRESAVFGWQPAASALRQRPGALDLRHFRPVIYLVVTTYVTAFAFIYRYFLVHTLGSFAFNGLVCVVLWVLVVSALTYLFRHKADLAEAGGAICIGMILLSGGQIAFIYAIFTTVVWLITGNK
jgi:hypothetical protein